MKGFLNACGKKLSIDLLDKYNDLISGEKGKEELYNKLSENFNHYLKKDMKIQHLLKNLIYML